MRSVLETIKSIIVFVMGVINKVFDGVEDWILERVLKDHRNVLRCFWHGFYKRRSLAEYRQDSQYFWRSVSFVGFVVYPLAYGVLWILTKIFDNERFMHAILRIMIIGMIIATALNPTLLLWWRKPASFEVAIPALLIDHALSFNPIKMLVSLVILDFDLYFSDFMAEDADDWELEEERKKGRLNEYKG